MSSSDNNITLKKTSFLSGINSEFINKFYSDYLLDPKSIPDSWKNFFDGLSEDEKLVLQDLNAVGSEKNKKISESFEEKKKRMNTDLDIGSINKHQKLSSCNYVDKSL